MQALFARLFVLSAQRALSLLGYLNTGEGSCWVKGLILWRVEYARNGYEGQRRYLRNRDVTHLERDLQQPQASFSRQPSTLGMGQSRGSGAAPGMTRDDSVHRLSSILPLVHG